MHSVGVGARVYHLDGLVAEKLLILRFKRSSATQGSVMKINLGCCALLNAFIERYLCISTKSPTYGIAWRLMQYP